LKSAKKRHDEAVRAMAELAGGQKFRVKGFLYEFTGNDHIVRRSVPEEVVMELG